MPNTDSRAGWEKIWTSGNIPPRYRSSAEPNLSVVEWADSLLPGTSILDIGCGIGRHSIYLAQRGFHMSGVDISPSAIKMTHELLTTRQFAFDGHTSDMSILPWPDHAFGAALSTSTLHHHKRIDIAHTLGEVKRVLEPGGLFLVDFPSTATLAYQEARDIVNAGKLIEVEPNTFVDENNTSGDEDAFLPHHYCDEADLRELLSNFEIQRLWADLQNVTRNGISGKWGKWIVLARRPMNG